MSSKIMNFLRFVYEVMLRIKDMTFPLLLNNKRPRRSIVRLIGSALPLSPAPKLFIHLPAFRPCVDIPIPNDGSSLTTEDGDDSSKGAETLSDWSDAVCVHDATIHQLQEELKNLREQVAAILLKQTDLAESPELVETEEPPVPPPPPPPPPPLPPPPPVLPAARATPVRQRKPLAPRNDQGGLLSEVLKEMKTGRPKLKPIERSPGGRPVKPPKKASDPSDILMEVLQKRFNAVNFSPDSLESDESSGTEYSSEWKTCFI